ncbi:MAG TPA: hypothetical protein VME22_27535 [Solirubrobacteraceae bacterium]|nr:hypothetical protein [Solirubrobacteraceae bacterium]
MELEMIVLVAIAGWIALVLVVLSVCRAAKRGDEVEEITVTRAMAAEPDTEIADSPPSERPLRSLGLDHAATLLGVSPHTLLAWQVRYGFPTSSPSEPRYNQSEVLALRDSLEHGLSIPSAVSRARQQTKRRRGTTATPPFDRRDGGLAS